MLNAVKTTFLSNKTPKQTIAKNTFWLFFGNLGSKMIRAFILVYAARKLGVLSWGNYSYSLSIAYLLTMFIDFGITTLIIRETNKKLETIGNYFITGFVIKLVMMVITLISTSIFIPIIYNDQTIIKLIILMVFFSSLESLKDFSSSLYYAKEKMEMDALIQLSTNTLIMLSGLVALKINPTPTTFATGYTVGVIISLIITLIPYRKFVFNFRKLFSQNLIKPIILSSWPLGVAGIFHLGIMNADNIIIDLFKGTVAVGLCAAAQKIVSIIYMLPGMFSNSVFPTMNKYVGTEMFTKILKKNTDILMTISFPLVCGGVLLSSEIIKFLYGQEFSGASLCFAVLCLTFLVNFITAPISNALFSLKKEKKITVYVILIFITNLAFNLILIPRLGIVGSAIATIISQIIGVGYLIYSLKKEIVYNLWDKKILKSLVAVLAMTFITYTLKNLHVQLVLNIVISAIAYAIGLLLTKEENFCEIIQIIKRKIKTSLNNEINTDES